MQSISSNRPWVPSPSDFNSRPLRISITHDRGAQVTFAARSDGDALQHKTDTLAASDINPISRRGTLNAVCVTTLASLAATTTLPTMPSYAAFPDPSPAATKLREAKMVMRVTALRGSVPVSWVQEFSTAMEGYGIVAMTQKPQVLDIWHDLKGEIEKEKGKKGRRKKKEPKPTTVDAVTLGDAWLGAAIAQGLIQPIPDAKEHRYWVRYE